LNLDRPKAIFLLVLLAGACLCLALAFAGNPSKWVSSASVLFGLAGVVQLEISGLFERVFNEYNDEQKYPGGPPSRITRIIIDNPNTPIRTELRNLLF
jgi:hypothetical protein